MDEENVTQIGKEISHQDHREALTSGNRKKYQTELEGSPATALRHTGHHQSTEKNEGRIVDVEEDEDDHQEESASHRHNRPREVKLGNIRIDNGAAHTFTRTNTTGPHIARISRKVSMGTGMPQDHQQGELAAFKDERLGPSVVQKTKVTDEVSQTAVGSLSRRIASSTRQELLEQKADENGPEASNTKHARNDQGQSTESLHHLLDLDLRSRLRQQVKETAWRSPPNDSS